MSSSIQNIIDNKTYTYRWLKSIQIQVSKCSTVTSGAHDKIVSFSKINSPFPEMWNQCKRNQAAESRRLVIENRQVQSNVSRKIDAQLKVELAASHYDKKIHEVRLKSKQAPSRRHTLTRTKEKLPSYVYPPPLAGSIFPKRNLDSST